MTCTGPGLSTLAENKVHASPYRPLMAVAWILVVSTAYLVWEQENSLRGYRCAQAAATVAAGCCARAAPRCGKASEAHRS